MDKIRTLTSLQRSFERICEQFIALDQPTVQSIVIEVTDGALDQNYLNLKPALSAGMLQADRDIRISFIGLNLEPFVDYVKPNGYLHDRSNVRRFYEEANIRNGDRRIRFTKASDGEYTLEPLEVPANRPSRINSTDRLPPFQFSKCGINVGEIIVYADDPSIVCTVYDDKHVLYEGHVYSLSRLAQILRGLSYTPQGQRFFTYNGELLSRIRRRIEDEE